MEDSGILRKVFLDLDGSVSICPKVLCECLVNEI